MIKEFRIDSGGDGGCCGWLPGCMATMVNAAVGAAAHLDTKDLDARRSNVASSGGCREQAGLGWRVAEEWGCAPTRAGGISRAMRRHRTTGLAMLAGSTSRSCFLANHHYVTYLLFICFVVI